MTWPTTQDFCRAIKNPSAAFADPDLKAGDPVIGPDGWPLAVPGRGSDVFQVCAADGRSWAIKCYRQPDHDLARRYAKIEEAMEHAGLAFTVGCGFLEQGVRVGEEWFPCLKLEWVEGQTLHRVARDQAGNPAALDSIFLTWVRLCRKLREAGIAHGDLEASNALLVPGPRAGAYGVKLVDYDAVFVPALAAFPFREQGHPAFQHPARAVARISSLDVDRFPHLVIGTALKGLSIAGPDLWDRYGGPDHLLFKPEDLKAPAASPLMKELWQTENPALQALVGRLALASMRRIPETPWLDQITAEGEVAPMSPNDYREASAALGFGVPKSIPVSAQPAAPVGDALSLDDEIEEPARTPLRMTGRPVAMRKTPPPPRKSFPLVPASIAVGILLIFGGVVAGVLTADKSKGDDEALAVHNEEPSQPAQPPVKPVTPPKPSDRPAEPADVSKVVLPSAADVVADPDVRIVFGPPDPPAFQAPPNRLVIAPPNPPPAVIPPGGVGFQRVWTKPANDVRGSTRLHFAPDGQTVFFSANGQTELLDAKTGAPKITLRGVPTSVNKLWTLDGNRVALSALTRTIPTVFDIRTGNPLPELVAPALMPPATGMSNFEWEVSRDGRYVFMGNYGRLIANGRDSSMYRIVDTATGKILREGEWTYGSARFTADSSKLLVAGTDGQLMWIKVPSGEIEREWKFDPNSFPRNIAGMSADGSLFVYHGKAPGQPFDSYLVDGKTGQVLRKCGPSFGGDRGTLSADGRWLAGVTYEMPNFRQYNAVITDARTRAVLVRTPLDGGINDFMRAAFSPDARSFVISGVRASRRSAGRARSGRHRPPAAARLHAAAAGPGSSAAAIRSAARGSSAARRSTRPGTQDSLDCGHGQRPSERPDPVRPGNPLHHHGQHRSPHGDGDRFEHRPGVERPGRRPELARIGRRVRAPRRSRRVPLPHRSQRDGVEPEGEQGR